MTMHVLPIYYYVFQCNQNILKNWFRTRLFDCKLFEIQEKTQKKKNRKRKEKYKIINVIWRREEKRKKKKRIIIATSTQSGKINDKQNERSRNISFAQ